MVRLPPAIVAIAAILAAIACGGSDTSSTATPSTDFSRDDVLWFAPLAVAALEKEAGFNVVLPTYIPRGVGPQPRYAKGADARSIDVTYYPRDGYEGPLAPLIELSETTTEHETANTEAKLVGGKRVQVDEFPGGTDTSGASAGYAVYWQQADLWLIADFTWAGQNGQRLMLSEEMRVVAHKVVESIINQEESPDND